MKIAYISIGMTSALNAGLELSRRLGNAGHQVTLLSQADIGPRVAAEGFDFLPLRGDRAFREQDRELDLSWSELRRPTRFLRRLAQRKENRRRSVEQREVEQVLEELSPDLLLIDMEMHVAILASASLKLPTALLMVWFSIFRAPGLPPLHLDRPAPVSGLQRIRVELDWCRLWLETRHMEWRRRIGRWRRGDFFPAVVYDTVDIDDVRAVARGRGFALGRRTSRSHWLRPWVYTDLPILCFNGSELELPHPPLNDKHPGRLVSYVGPMVPDQRNDPRADTLGWRQWHELREGGSEATRPLIYASLGTYWSADEDFLKRIIAVFERRRDWDLVLGLGDTLKPEALGSAPDNVLVLPYAPQLEILKAADLAITHGGIGTINECLLHRVPMVVYSTGFVDQHGCAVRVAHHGVGVVGNKDADDVETIEKTISQALEDPELRHRVEAMGRALESYARRSVAEELILKLARQEISPELNR